MKIGIDISQIVYQGTGTATYTANLVENLVRLRKTDDFYLFGSSLRQKKALRDFFDRFRGCQNVQSKLASFPPTLLDFLWNRRHVFNVENLIGNVDLFHSSDWTQPPSKSKKVTTVHDLVVFKYPETLHPKIISAHTQRLTWVKKECDLVIAVSESTKRDLIEILEIPEKKIRVVYEAASEDYWKYSRRTRSEKVDEAVRLGKKYSLENKYILAVGTNEPRKNLPALIKAFLKLNPNDLDLVIVGKYGWGPELGLLPTNVKLLGYVPQTDLPGLFGGALAFVYPSLYEGFGIPVAEAMTVGVPVVISNVSSLPEVGGNVAVYVNPHSEDDIAEKIKFVLNLTATKYKTLQDKSLVQAQKFSWGKTAQETFRVYNQVI